MEQDEPLHSFQFCEEVDGVEHDYRITEKADHIFGVEKDGELIAELTNNNRWEQLSGTQLPKPLIQKISDRIEDHYD